MITGRLDRLADQVGVFSRVVHALMLREAKTRYGHSQIGYLWAVGEWLIHLGTLWTFYTLLGRHTVVNASMPAFLLTGLFPFFTWRSCAVRGATALESNLPLMTYPQVKPFSVVMSRVLLEMATSIVVALVIVFLLCIYGGEQLQSFSDHPLDLFGAVGALSLLGLGAAMFDASLSRIVGVWPEVIRNLSRVFYLTSGVFFTMDALPPNIRDIIMINPLAHQIDWIRSAALPGYDSDHFSRFYVLAWGVGLLFAGLVIDWVLRLLGHWEAAG